MLLGNKKTMSQKVGSKKKQHANLFGASLWPREAQVWMDTALRLDYESKRSQKDSNVDHNKLNVAHVCTGLAFELAYKSLLVAEFKPLERTHSVEKLHEMLKEETQGIIDRYIKEVGWKDSTYLLEYLDERMTHPDRKYWMENPWKREKTGTSFVIAEGIMAIPGLAPILRKLVNLGFQNLEKARKYFHDLLASLDNYKKAKVDQADLTDLKSKVLDSIKAFRSSYGNAVDLNQIIYFQIPEEFTEILDSSDDT